MMKISFNSIFKKKNSGISRKIVAFTMAVLILALSLMTSNAFAVFSASNQESMVLKIAADVAVQNRAFGQKVAVDPTKEYEFSFYFLPDDLPWCKVCHFNSNTTVGNGTEIYDKTWSKYTYRFKVAEPQETDEHGNSVIWVGFDTRRLDKDVYYYGFNLCDTSNPDVNLLKDSDMTSGGDKIDTTIWQDRWGNPVNLNNKSGVRIYSKVTLSSIGGIEAFKKTMDSEPMAVKLAANTTGGPYFGQAVSLNPSKEYEFSYFYMPDTKTYPMVFKNVSFDWPLEYEIKEDSNWYKRRVTFKVPDSAPDDTDIPGNKMMWVGLQASKEAVDLYFYGFEVHEVSEPEVNLLMDTYMAENGNNINTAVWQVPWGDGVNTKVYSKVTLASIGGVEVFKKNKSEQHMVLKLEPKTTGQPFFGQVVSLNPENDYVLSYYFTEGFYANSTVNHNLTEKLVSDYEITYDRKWSKVYMEFSVPKDAPDDSKNPGNKLMWVGFRGQYAEEPIYYYGMELYEKEDTENNLLKDTYLQNNKSIDNSIWKTTYGTKVSTAFSKVTLESIGGIDAFLKKANTEPKMMYYTRTDRGPNQETYGCFSLNLPDSFKTTGSNYVLQFDARALKGVGLYNFRCGTIIPEMRLDENGTIEPASINGYTYSFNLRFDPNSERKVTFMIFAPKSSEGYISNVGIYRADENFNKLSERNLISDTYGDFSNYDLGDTVNFYTMQGACLGTETGKLTVVPEHFFEIPPSVPVPAGEKMMSYASLWDAGSIDIKLPYSVEKGSIDGKRYYVSVDIRPTVGRDPSKFYTSGVEGESVQVTPLKIDGYTYVFGLLERYNFHLSLEFPYNCEGYISNLKMYEADEDFVPINNKNLATAFGKNGNFSNITMQEGMKWNDISFSGGFVNTFADTRLLAQELLKGIPGDYHCSGGIWLIPANYFVAEKDENWAGDENNYVTEFGRIIGSLKNSSGQGLQGFMVKLMSIQDPDYVLKATTDEKGSFAFNSVPIGGYDVSIITGSGNEIYGDDSVWIEEDEDIVTLNLEYTGNDLYFDDDTDSAENVKLAATKKKKKKAVQNEDYTLVTVAVCTVVVLVLGGVVFLILRKRRKSKKIIKS